MRSTLPCGRGGSGRSSSAAGNGAEPRGFAMRWSLGLRWLLHDKSSGLLTMGSKQDNRPTNRLESSKWRHKLMGISGA